MKTYNTITFDKNIEFEDDLHFLGVTKVNGSLRAFSLKFNKELHVETTLESTKGAIFSVSSLKVGKDMISKGDVTIRGQCEVAGRIIGNNLKFTGDSIITKSIEAQTVKLRGNITVNNGISASKAIQINLNPRKYTVLINGTIQAPKIILIFGGFYTKWFKVPTTILGMFGRKRRVKQPLIIENLSITTDKLVIKSRYEPSRIEVQYSNCEIDTKETEVRQWEEI